MVATHTTRTSEQRVAAHREKIETLEQKIATEEASRAPHVKSLLAAARAIQRARAAARAANATDMLKAFDGALKKIRDHALTINIALPKEPKLREPKPTTATTPDVAPAEQKK